MSNTFWAVFFGTAAGLGSVTVIQAYIDEYRAKKRTQRMHDLLDALEDADFEDIEDQYSRCMPQGGV